MSTLPEIDLVVAMDRAGAIGRDGGLPWHLPGDLKLFKATTLGHPILMGRKTALSLGRALPGRRNLVLTRGNAAPFEGMEVAHSLDDALARAADDGATRLCVIGGAEIFALALPRAGRLHKTYIDTVVEGADTFFPDYDESAWRIVRRVPHAADAKNAFGFELVEYTHR